MHPDLTEALHAADRLRRDRQWRAALRAYQALQAQAPGMAVLAHHRASCHLALGEWAAAQAQSEQAMALAPEFWQAGMLLSRAQLAAGEWLPSLRTLYRLQQRFPAQTEIAMEIAQRNRDQLCHPRAAARALSHLVSDPHVGLRARLQGMQASLLDPEPGTDLVGVAQRLAAEGRQHLTPARREPTARPAPGSPLTIGIIAHTLTASANFFLTIGALQGLSHLARILVFHRGEQRDWATRAFEALATQWVDVSAQSATELARSLRQHPVHALIDMVGWSDTAVPQALATQPAMRQYLWAAGQTVSTGLMCYSGFLSDEHLSPAGSEYLHSEPLLRLAGGHVSYSPPPYAPPSASPGSDAVRVGVVGDPAHLSADFLAHVRTHWPRWQALSMLPLELHLIDPRYRPEPLQQRLRDALGAVPLRFVVPANHAEQLAAVGRLHAVIDPWPCSHLLETLEAHHLGVPVYHRQPGALFCERHAHAQHQRLALPLPPLDSPDFTPAQALLLDRALWQRQARRQQDHHALARELARVMLR